MERIFFPLLKAAGIGVVCGVVFGFIGGMQMYWNAVEKARDMHPRETGTYLCAAGKAPIELAILGIPAGAFIGLNAAGLMILYREDME
jgi:hypothetical protein